MVAGVGVTHLKTAAWANTTIAAGDTAEEIDKLRLDGDGYMVRKAVSRSLLRMRSRPTSSPAGAQR